MSNVEDFQAAFFNSLDEFISKFKTTEKAADALGITLGTLNAYKYRYRKPKFETAKALMQKMQGAEDDIAADMQAYCLIPKVAAKAGAGASLETSGETSGLYAFRNDFISRIGINAHNAVMMDVVGDSMEPLIQNGDTILIDQHDKNITDGQIYVVTLGDELRVKRIYKGINGLILRSENTRYPDINVSSCEIESLVIHGRVRWFGRVI